MTLTRPMVLRLALLAALVGVGAVVVLQALPRIDRYRATEAVCEAAESGDWAAALEGSADLVGDDAAGHRAAQCRCQALLATGERSACGELMEELITISGSEGWLPDPLLTAVAVRSRMERGDLVGAAELARRGSLTYPADTLLARMELELRSRTEDEASVLGEIERRLSERASAGSYHPLELRLDLAWRFFKSNDWARALEVLGDDPDRFAGELRDAWYAARVHALAGAGHEEALAEAFEEWKRRGGDEAELLARHALLRSAFQMEDSQATTLRMLREAVARKDELEGSPLLEGVFARLIGTLVVGGLHDQALAVYDDAVETLGEFDYIPREDVLRSATQALLGERGLAAANGVIRFRIAEARPGDRLLLAPDVEEPIDTAYQELEIPASGQVEVTRALGTWPVRWVLRDRRGRTAGSGGVWVRPDGTVDVTVERRSAEPEASLRPDPEARPERGGDGQRRVFQVILDCADWRAVRYGLARAELPFFAEAIKRGHRAILESRPPATAIAITRLVYPRKRGTSSFPELLHQLGREIEGLNFIGRNPFSGLEWVLPHETQLFETLAQEGLSTVNLLHSWGSIQVGRNAQVLGPGDRVRQLDTYQPSRPLEDWEASLLLPQRDAETPDDADKNVVPLLEEMAADFDVVEHLAEETDVDFVVLRVASLDLLTHSRFKDLQNTAQDDGNLVLYRAYRYIDRRLDGLHERLDRDDVLIVMSDHGIRTPLEHDPRAMFIALGEAIEPGRTDHTPPIQEVSGWVAEMFGLEVDWPGAGSQEWILPPGSQADLEAPETPSQTAPLR